MFTHITQIRVHSLNTTELFPAVLREITDLCDNFTCYPAEEMLIVQSNQNSATDIADILRMRGLNTEHIVCKML